MRLVSKYENFMAPFFILPQQGEIYMKKIRPVLAQRSLPGQPPYFFLNKQGGRLCGSSMSNFFTESFEKCCGEKSVRPHMIRHSVASYIRDNKPEMLETAAGFVKHALATSCDDRRGFLISLWPEWPTKKSGIVFLPAIP
jgi:integrase